MGFEAFTSDISSHTIANSSLTGHHRCPIDVQSYQFGTNSSCTFDPALREVQKDIISKKEGSTHAVHSATTDLYNISETPRRSVSDSSSAARHNRVHDDPFISPTRSKTDRSRLRQLSSFSSFTSLRTSNLPLTRNITQLPFPRRKEVPKPRQTPSSAGLRISTENGPQEFEYNQHKLNIPAGVSPSAAKRLGIQFDNTQTWSSSSSQASSVKHSPSDRNVRSNPAMFDSAEDSTGGTSPVASKPTVSPDEPYPRVLSPIDGTPRPEHPLEIEARLRRMKSVNEWVGRSTFCSVSSDSSEEGTSPSRTSGYTSSHTSYGLHNSFGTDLKLSPGPLHGSPQSASSKDFVIGPLASSVSSSFNTDDTHIEQTLHHTPQTSVSSTTSNQTAGSTSSAALRQMSFSRPFSRPATKPATNQSTTNDSHIDSSLSQQPDVGRPQSIEVPPVRPLVVIKKNFSIPVTSNSTRVLTTEPNGFEIQRNHPPLLGPTTSEFLVSVAGLRVPDEASRPPVPDKAVGPPVPDKAIVPPVPDKAVGPPVPDKAPHRQQFKKVDEMNVKTIVRSKKPTHARKRSAPAVSADAAEVVILRIFESLETFQDLFACARLAKGFYSVFKTHELHLMKNTLRNMSPAEWELREASPKEIVPSLERPNSEYTPTRYIQFHRRDCLVLASLKMMIRKRCQKVLRSITIAALTDPKSPDAARFDDALWRIWTFCTIFGVDRKSENDVEGQIDWLRGKDRDARPMTASRGHRTKMSITVTPNFGKGNYGGLSSDELQDMLEMWDALKLLLQGVVRPDRFLQARKCGIFERQAAVPTRMQSEQSLLDEWVHWLTSQGLSTVNDLAPEAEFKGPSVFATARDMGWHDWPAPTDGRSRGNFLREPISRLQEELKAEEAAFSSFAQETVRDRRRSRNMELAASMRDDERRAELRKSSALDDKNLNLWVEWTKKAEVMSTAPLPLSSFSNNDEGGSATESQSGSILPPLEQPRKAPRPGLRKRSGTGGSFSLFPPKYVKGSTTNTPSNSARPSPISTPMRSRQNSLAQTMASSDSPERQMKSMITQTQWSKQDELQPTFSPRLSICPES